MFSQRRPRFAIDDVEAKKPLLLTEEVLGNTSWKQISIRYGLSGCSPP